jgi:cytochrome c553
MKKFNSFNSMFALPAAVLAVGSLAYAQERSSAPAIVTHTCSGCHGLDGQSQLPYIPRLAGLSAAYTERKLARFQTGAAWPVDEAFSRIVHPGNSSKEAQISAAATAHMVGLARTVSEEDKKAAAKWYAAQKPARGSSGNRKLIEAGRALFSDGLESQGLTACQACHGAEAQGTEIAPRLAGQNAQYVAAQLSLFRAGGYRQSPEMTAVARSVEGDQARAIAAYLQSR